MKIKAFLASLPERVYLIVCILITVIGVLVTFRAITQTTLVNKKTVSRQNELARIVGLKEAYLAKKASLAEGSSTKEKKQPLTLGLVEEMVLKSFVSGRLTILRPSSFKEDKGKTVPVVEVRVGGVALGEAVSFMNGIESAGLHVKRFQLVLPQGQMLLDLFAVVAER